jgi:hypothetical protein
MEKAPSSSWRLSSMKIEVMNHKSKKVQFNGLPVGAVFSLGDDDLPSCFYMKLSGNRYASLGTGVQWESSENHDFSVAPHSNVKLVVDLGD